VNRGLVALLHVGKASFLKKLLEDAGLAYARMTGWRREAVERLMLL
jgi:hypothetical protein